MSIDGGISSSPRETQVGPGNKFISRKSMQRPHRGVATVVIPFAEPEVNQVDDVHPPLYAEPQHRH